MSVAKIAHQKICDLLNDYAPSPLWLAVYNTHKKAHLIVPSLSVDVETDTPLENDAAIINQELIDNRNIQISIRLHINYRLGPSDTNLSMDMVDDVIQWLRQHINLGNGYRIFDVSGTAYDVEHISSGTIGAEINVNIHKVTYYEQID